MKKTHVWKEAVKALCPHCWEWSVFSNVGDEGDIVVCHKCNNQFQLGKQR